MGGREKERDGEKEMEKERQTQRERHRERERERERESLPCGSTMASGHLFACNYELLPLQDRLFV